MIVSRAKARALLDSAQKVVIGCVVISMFIYFFAVVGNACVAAYQSLRRRNVCPYVLKSWRPEATYVAGKFPPFGAPVVSLVGTKNAKRLFALSGGRLTVWRRDSRWKPPHIRAREKQLHPSLDDAPEEEEAPQEEYEKAPETKAQLEEREDDARAEAQKTKYEKSLEPEPLVRIFEADVPREEGAFVQAVAVSPDGTYVVVASGSEVIRYKRKENTRKETYEIEATMAPSASYARSDVMALCVVNNRLPTRTATSGPMTFLRARMPGPLELLQPVRRSRTRSTTRRSLIIPVRSSLTALN